MIHASALLRRAETLRELAHIAKLYQLEEIHMAKAKRKLASMRMAAGYIDDDSVQSVNSLLTTKYEELLKERIAPFPIERAPSINKTTGVPDFTDFAKKICFKIYHTLPAPMRDNFDEAVQDFVYTFLHTKSADLDRKGSETLGYSNWLTVKKQIVAGKPGERGSIFESRMINGAYYNTLEWLKTFFQGLRSPDYKCLSCGTDFHIKDADKERELHCPSCNAVVPFNPLKNISSMDAPANRDNPDAGSVSDLITSTTPDEVKEDQSSTAEQHEMEDQFFAYLDTVKSVNAPRVKLIYPRLMGGGDMSPDALRQAFPALANLTDSAINNLSKVALPDLFRAFKESIGDEESADMFGNAIDSRAAENAEKKRQREQAKKV